MKKTVLLVAITVLLIAATVHAAGDLTVEGTLTVGGLISADKTFQCGSAAYNTFPDYDGDGWKDVDFAIAFDGAPVIIATGERVNVNYPHFFVGVKDVTANRFEFKFWGHDGTNITAGTNIIHWCAFARTQ